MFHSGTSLENTKINFEEALFSSMAHLATQTDAAIHSFYLFRDRDTVASATFRCAAPAGPHFRSPVRAPFGGLQCEEHCSVGELSFLLATVARWLRRRGAVTMEIKTAPACYQSDVHQKLHKAYLASGFTVRHLRKNWHIPVKDDFVSHLHISASRRMKKAVHAGLRAGLPTHFQAGDAYAFFKKCRMQKNYPMSMDSGQFEQLTNCFPEKIRFFGLLDENKLAALSLIVRPAAHVVYNFLSDYDENYRQLSPAILLTSQIYEDCLQNNVSVLDLGISLDHHGKFKPSLAAFKERIGGQLSEKITYFMKL